MLANVQAVSSDEDLLICVDENDQEVGHLDKRTCHDGDGRLHRALSVFLFNSRGQVLLQQRSPQKRLWPLWWANSCCSHPRRGEATASAASRRLAEELGVHSPLHYTHKFIYQAQFGREGSEHELCYVYVAKSDAPLTPHPQEICATAWLVPSDLDQAMADPAAPYTPWLRLEWQTLRAAHWAQIEQLTASQ